MTEQQKIVEAAKSFFMSQSGPHVDLAALQGNLAAWQNRNFGAQPIVNQTLGVCEEAGELAHAVLKMEQAIRGMQDRSAFLEAAGDAIADCTVFLMQVATTLRLDFATLLVMTADRVMQRDFTKDKNGGEVAVV